MITAEMHVGFLDCVQRHALLLRLEAYLVSGSVTESGHLNIFDAESLRLVCSPLDGDLVVEI